LSGEIGRNEEEAMRWRRGKERAERCWTSEWMMIASDERVQARMSKGRPRWTREG
jgi:hypothetical protein